MAKETLDPDYSNPMAIAIRQEVKRDLMSAINSTPIFPEQGRQAGQFWLYGSSSMNAHWHSGIKFPFQAKKSLDVDLSLYNCSDSFAGAKKSEKTRALSEYFRHVFSSIGVTPYNPKTKMPQDYSGTGECILELTPDEEIVKRAISFHPELKPEEYSIPEKVSLKFDFSLDQPPMLLPPIPHKLFSTLEQSQCYVDDPRNFLAKKIARCIVHNNFRYEYTPIGFKPRDLLDIYNLVHANPPILNLNPSDPNNDLGVIRMITVCSAVSMGKDILNASPDNFIPTQEAKNQFNYSLREILSKNFTLDDSDIGNILGGMEQLLHTVFPETKHGKPVALTDHERKFISKCLGYETLPGGKGTRQIDIYNLGIEPLLLIKSAESVFKHKIPSKISDDFTSRCLNLRGLTDKVEKITELRSGMDLE
jgi:hypothetical protein